MSPRARAASVASSCTLIGDGDDEIFEQDLIDLTISESSERRHDLIREGEAAVSSLAIQDGSIRIGDFIQVADTTFGNYKVEFILVKVLLRSSNHQGLARGVAFARTRCMLGKLPKKLNELCMIHHFDKPPQQGQQRTALVDVPASSIDGKCPIIMTNGLYPLHNPKQTTFVDFGDQATRMIAIEEHGTLVCRWKLEVYKLGTCRRSKHYEEVFTRILPEDVPDSRYRVDESGIRQEWRGETVRGGSWPLKRHPQSPVRNGRDQDQRFRGQKYTLFDSFCGAGGVSRGADLAGFHAQYAVDKSPDVWETYKTNFPGCSLYMGSVDDFIKHNGTCQRKADILHLSPPCQPFSPAHTRAAANDDDNTFALMGCFSLIEATRPRIVTLEQTFGITHERHGEYLRALINDFTGQGFSLRWQIVRLATWGSAQDRKRLILIAAAPGERLPPFPRPSHSEDGIGGLKSFNTIAKALSQAMTGDDLHDLDTVRRHDPPKAPYRGDRLSGTITTSPGGFYHPDGTRDLTLREYASLQGFPRHHTFSGTRTSILRQIGNAFPPNTVRHLYKHLENWLLQQDGMTTYQPQDCDIVDLETATGGTTPKSERQRRIFPVASCEQTRATHDVDMTVVDVMEICGQQPTPIIDLT
jgi:DNA (cytosine-5)-methyltransferase 1